MARSSLSVVSGGRRRAVWVLGVGVVTAGLTLFGPLRASAADSDLDAAAARLTQLGDFLDNAANASQLTDLIPLSDLAPKDALALADVFDDDNPDPSDSLKEKLAALTGINDVADFQTKLDAVHFDAPAGVTVDIGGPTAADGSDGHNDGTPVVRKNVDGSVDIGMHIAITKEVDVPLQFATSLVDLVAAGSDGTFPVDISLATNDLHVHFDKALAADAGTAADALWIMRQPDNTLFTGGTAPTITASVSSTGASLTALGTNLGFTAVDVTGSFSFDFGYALEILDPDASGGNPGDGKISAPELISTAPADLLQGGLTDDPSTDAVHASIAIDSDLLSGSPDVTITYQDASLIDGTPGGTSFSPTTPPIGDFKNFSAQEALGAVVRLLTMLNGIQGSGKLDVALPFITGKTNAVDPSAAATGTFSDVLRVSNKLLNAISDPPTDPNPGDNDIAAPSADPANPNALGVPDFTDAQSLATALETALGLSAGTILPDYDVGTKRLSFELNLGDSYSTQASLNFGDLDILAGIQMTTGGTVNLDASYDLPLTFALDLNPEPTEPAVGGAVGSCADGIDNDGVGDMDAADAACAAAKTLEQRVALDVSNPEPELTARLGVTASNVDAIARIGLLQAGINDASLVVGSKDGEDGSGPASCADGTDDDSDTLIDMADPDCRAAVTIDLADTGDGWITVEDVLNALGGSAPAGVSLSTHLNAGLDSTVPVAADLLPSSPGGDIGGGDIVVTGDFDAELTSPGELLDPANGHIDIDASDLHLGDIFAFSPCSNSEDDDGDGTVNDGCDAIPAVDEPEESSIALFNKIIDAIKGISEQFDNLGIFPAGTLDAELPLVGVSFNDLVSFADTLGNLADGAANAAESSIGAGACTNTADDDGDGVVNDGCPTTSGGPDASPGLPESDCVDVDLPDAGFDAQGDDDGDGTVNDGCQPVTPSLQQLSSLIDSTITRLLLPVDPSPTVDITIAYDPSTEDITFDSHIVIDRTLATQFTLGSLPGILGTLVSLDPLDASLALTADLQLGFGVNLGDFTPFVLGSSGLDLGANVVGENLAFHAGAGSLTIDIGQTTATPEGAGDCANGTDDDGDGFVNDGCAPVPNPESGGNCSNGTDDDGDGRADDGCGGSNPPASGTAESGAQCTDLTTPGSGWGVNDDPGDDAVVDDGCAGGPPPAQAGPSGDTESDGSPDGGASCAITDTDDDDGDGVANDGCPAKADKGRFFIGAGLTLDVGPSSGDDDTHYTLGGGGTPLTFTGDFNGTDQAGCDGVVIPAGPNTIGDPVAANDDKFGCAILPLYFAGNPLGAAPDGHHVNIAITDFSPLSISVHYDTSQLLSIISSNLIDLVLMNSGLDSLFDALQSLLESDLFSFALPIIGGQTATAAGIVDDLRATVKDAINTAVSGGNPLSGAVSAGDIQNLLDNLADSITTAITSGDLTTSPAVVELYCGTNGDEPCDTGFGEADPANVAATGGAGTDAYCDSAAAGTDTLGNGVDDDGDGVIDDGCAGGANPTPAAETALNVTDVRLTFDIGGSVNLLDLPDLAFDIGVPGLGLKGDADPQGTIDWSIKFGFGVSKNEGFYFYTGNDPEIGVDLDVKLSDNASNPASLTGTLGFLQVAITDGDPVATCTDSTLPDTPCRRAGDAQDPLSHLGATFSVDITDPGATDDSKLTFADLSGGPSFSEMIVFSLTATADVNLHIETGFPGGAGLPKLIADLHLDWGWGISSSDDPDALAPGTNSDLAISLDGVGLDVGTYVTKFLKPLFGDIKRFTDPLKPVIDTVTACIPVLTDLSGDCVSLLTLAEIFGPSDINYDFIKQVIGIIKFIQGLPTDAPGNLTIPIGDGSFDLAGEHLQEGELAAEEATSAFADPLGSLPSLMGSLNGQPFVQGAGGSAASENGIDAPAVKADGLAGIGVTFPFLEHPEKLLGLLFGQDIDLVIWQPQELSISFSYSQKFGPIWAVPPVFIEIGGSVSVTGRFGIGYTSKGFRNWLVNDQGPAALLQGLFLVDKHPLEGGPDSNELELKGELFANAQVSVLIFSAGAQGSIYLTIGIDLQDPNSDGRLEYDEAADIIRSTGNVLCIFNLNGKFGVRISVFAEIDLFFWSQRWEFTLADIVLYEFKVECKPLPDPVLARKDGSTLRLNVGADRYKRDPEEYASPPYIVEPGSTPAGFTNSPDGVADNSVGFDTIDEDFKVTKVEHDGGGFDVKVSALGVTQVYAGPFTQIAGDAGDGDDKITLADAPAKNGSKLLFDIGANLGGGTGTDELTGSTVNDTLVGGDGPDKITGRDGVNTIHGDNADGTGTGNDVIDSGTGNDHLFGEGGDDRISAGLGGDEIVGGDGSDNLDGGRSTPAQADGNDTIWGDKSDGTGTGDDHIDGNDGNDTIHAGLGKDRVDGGPGTDGIDAGGSSDPACSGNLDDVLIGGPGVDTISAGDGDDIVIGGSVLTGQPDAGDTLDGQNDCDTIFGDNAQQGPNGPFDVSALDPTIGGADTIRGGNQADTIHGQLGADVIHGDDDVPADDVNDGNDTIIGDEPGNAAGDDIVHADGGNDTVFGSPGDDDLIGGTGGDTIYGESGQDFVLGDDGNVSRVGARDAHDASFGGGNGNDHLFGGPDRDHLYGQGGSDEVNGDGGDDEAFGDTDEAANAASDLGDTVRGGIGSDLLSGGNADDDMYGESGNDRMIGGYVVDAADTGSRGDGFQDHMYGGSGTDVMAGDDATISGAGVVNLIAEASKGEGDLMFGEADADRMFGENGNDTMRGGDADDHAEGGDDSDTIHGEAGNDDLIGGTTEDADGGASTGQQPDAGDIITGGTGGDVILGDNGIITRPGGNRPDGTPTRLVTLYDLDDTSGTYSGEDTIDGNESYDAAYGGAEHDVVHGNSEDDHLEGNNGNDALSGDAHQDDIIGGTSGEVDEDGSNTVGGNHPDVGKDTIHGNAGHDVACGDNCSIRRTVAGAAQLVGDDLDTGRGITGVVRRQVQLYDIATVANSLTGTTTSDGDDLFGDGDFDIMYGQGGSDRLEGGAVDDYLEGNAGQDTVYGQGGQDDILGGTGRTTSDDPTSAADGRLDDHDDLFGGDGAGGVAAGDDYDVVMGDNATILRGQSSAFPNPPAGSPWDINTFNASVKRAVFLYDVATTTDAVPATTNGSDTMRGEADDDLMYGQGDGDDMDGAGGDDYMEGNEGADTIVGGIGNDDMTGGTGHINNDPFNTCTGCDGRPIGADNRLDSGELDMSGGDGFDWIAGDNAVISRVLDGDGAWVPDPNGGIKRNRIWLQDVAVAGGSAVSPLVSGGDGMHGNTHNDVMYGQGNGAGVSDIMTGDDGDDYMEGNAGIDKMHGNAGSDDMLGGTGRINNDPATGTPGRFDEGDFMFGDTGHDAALGDNAVLSRQLNGDGTWKTQAYGHTFQDLVPNASAFTRVIRDVVMVDTNYSVRALVAGSDLIHGGDGDDDLYGLFDDTGVAGGVPVTVSCLDGTTPLTVDDPNIDGVDATPVAVVGDLICGGPGEDAEVGDNGVIVNVVETGPAITITHKGAPMVIETARVPGTLTRQVTLSQIPTGGEDVLLGDDPTNGVLDGVQPAGDDAHDSLHAGAGNDLVNGGPGDDFLFGGDQSDAVWGGDHDDHLFGGYEGDFLDVNPRTKAQYPPDGDPLSWFLFAPDDPDTLDDPATENKEGYDGYRGFDIIYGGWGQDALQANMGGNGPVPGDRLFDWSGAYNAYYLCPATYGDYVSTRQMSPSMLAYLADQATADGATTVTSGNRTTSSGFDEAAIVYKPDIKFNTSPIHPDTPAHFTCT